MAHWFASQGRWGLIPWLVVLLGVLGLLTWHEAQALPEYAVQTGEPCSTCHASPSGGGLRTPRGQAWVGGGRPGAVLDLAQSLQLLGVNLVTDESAYVAVPGRGAPPGYLEPGSGHLQRIGDWLRDYPGN